jgi:hypothetical protein
MFHIDVVLVFAYLKKKDSEKILIKDVHDIDLLRRQPRQQPVEVQHESVD